MSEPKVQPTKSVRKSVKFKICKDSNDNSVKFKSGKGCEPRYMVHLRFLIKLVFEDSHKPIENSNCEDPNMKYQVFEGGKYICKKMPEIDTLEGLLEIYNDLLNFLDFIIPKMLTVPAGHNYKSLQVKKLISIRTKVLDKINCITETSVVKHDIIGTKYMIKHEEKMKVTMDILRNQNDKSHPSAIALRKEIEPYLLTPCTTPGNAPTVLSDDDMDDGIDGGSSKKKYKRKSKKKRSFKKRTIKNKSNRKYR
jgi:hypothetical protein